jgi:hypothetical protein
MQRLTAFLKRTKKKIINPAVRTAPQFFADHQALRGKTFERAENNASEMV